MDFLNNGFEFRGIHYRPLTARMLMILERVDSPFFTGKGGVQSLIDYLFVSSQSSASAIAASKSAETWIAATSDFADGFTSKDLEELGALVSAQNDEIASVVVEPVESSAKKKPASKLIGARS